MNKAKIKIIKRRDAEKITKTEIQNTRAMKYASASREKADRRLHRKVADTVSNWIAERRENNRNQQVSAIRKLLGDESLLNGAA